MTTLSALLLALAPQERIELPERWVYVQTNLWVDKGVDELEALLRRAAKAGYTGLLLADSKLAKLDTMDARYFRNVDRVKALAAELKLKVAPAVFHIGYSNSMLWHDPNLAEALPVRDALFVVKGGQARSEPDPAVALKAKWDWKDETVSDDFVTVDPKGKNARFSQKVKVKPFRQYHISVKVKTQDFKGQPEIKVLAKSLALNHASLGTKPTQDWTEHHIVFNSLEAEEVQIYFGTWGGKTGTLAWKEPRIEETGLVNLVRRDGAPFSVRTEDGKALEEGKDFERVTDPLLGTKPWKGEYTVYHEPPAIKTGLPDGTRLRVSYHHTVTVHDGQVMACPSEPKTVELLRDEIRRVHAAWGAKAYFMSHDEIRVLNQDEACRKRNLDAGQILADNARTCVKLLKEINPGGEIYVWNDMFDPHHNAHKDYYLVRGDLAGSWEGLDKDVIIAAWYYSKRNESLEFFGNRGHRVLMAGYYDGDPVENARGWVEAAKKHKNAVGIMYTTWEKKFGDLEKFMETVDRTR
jgi:hypothetical protein